MSTGFMAQNQVTEIKLSSVWDTLKESFSTALGVFPRVLLTMFLLFLVSLPVSFILFFVAAFSQSPVVGMGLYYVYALFTGAFVTGAVIAGAHQYLTSGSVETRHMIQAGFARSPAVLGYSLLYGLMGAVTFAPMIAAVFVKADTVVLILAGVVSLALYFYVAVKFMLLPVYAVFVGASAFNATWIDTRGRFWSLLLRLIVMFLGALLLMLPVYVLFIGFTQSMISSAMGGESAGSLTGGVLLLSLITMLLYVYIWSYYLSFLTVVFKDLNPHLNQY